MFAVRGGDDFPEFATEDVMLPARLVVGDRVILDGDVLPKGDYEGPLPLRGEIYVVGAVYYSCDYQRFEFCLAHEDNHEALAYFGLE